MKNIALSADGDRKIYAVPDKAADHLEEYCTEFFPWLWESPCAEEYRRDGVVWYNEDDFILWLNRYQFPEEPSTLVESLSGTGPGDPLPERYRDCPAFDF